MDWGRVLHFVRYNTGQHYLDSGQAYGRHWQQPPPQENCPVVYCDEQTSEDYYINGPTISTAAWLREYICEDQILTEKWLESKWYNDTDITWAAAAEQFMEDAGYFVVAKDNVYNHENDFDQVFIYEVWIPSTPDFNGEWWWHDDAVILVYVHTGCDVRGGYSPPIFSTHNNVDEWTFPLEWVVSFRLLEPTETVADQEQFDLGPAAEYVPIHNDDKWTSGYSSSPWSRVIEDCGDPVASEMIDDMAVYTMQDGSQVVGYYHP